MTGDKLREWREGNKLGRVALGDLLGVSERTIYRWGGGSNRPAGRLLVFALKYLAGNFEGEKMEQSIVDRCFWRRKPGTKYFKTDCGEYSENEFRPVSSHCPHCARRLVVSKGAQAREVNVPASRITTR